MADLIAIIFKPRRTIDKLLMEQNMKRSWQATWTIIALCAVLNLVYFMVGRDKLFAPFMQINKDLGMGTTGHNVSLALSLGIWAVATLYLLVDTILSRFGWGWFVRMGMRMVGGQQYASLSPQEKQERGRLMQMIQPYTYSIVIAASFISGLISLLTLQTPLASSDGLYMNGQPNMGGLLLQMIGSSFAGLISLGAIALMIVQRVFAVQKVYGVSGARAFWGPFIPYGILFVLLILLTIVVTVLIVMAAMSALDGLSNM